MHELNITHRDIKLENILVSDLSLNAYACLADFGISHKFQSPDETILFKIGTAGYIPPETIKNQPSGLGRDIWSLGVLLYIFLIARVPFHDKDRKLADLKICHQELDLASDPLASGLSDEAKDLL